MDEDIPEANPFASPLAPSSGMPAGSEQQLDLVLLQKSVSASRYSLYLLALVLIPSGMIGIGRSASIILRIGVLSSHWRVPMLATILELSVLMLALGVVLYFWGAAIGRFCSRPSIVTLEEMLLLQARFWRILAVGVVLLVLLGFAQALLL